MRYVYIFVDLQPFACNLKVGLLVEHGGWERAYSIAHRKSPSSKLTHMVYLLPLLELFSWFQKRSLQRARPPACPTRIRLQLPL